MTVTQGQQTLDDTRASLLLMHARALAWLFSEMRYHVAIKEGEPVDNPVILGIAFTVVPPIILLFMFLATRKAKK
jgi:hypothetical protein